MEESRVLKANSHPYSQKITRFTEPEDLLLYPQRPITGPYQDSDTSRSKPLILSPLDAL